MIHTDKEQQFTVDVRYTDIMRPLDDSPSAQMVFSMEKMTAALDAYKAITGGIFPTRILMTEGQRWEYYQALVDYRRTMNLATVVPNEMDLTFNGITIETEV